mmetsp:Transcript_13613/g.42979  ORF Transcript_13613/g.42979 Transcript_13613/m.42979 type:complete len:85 (+) Transcript_13613:899-1153(+)
MRHTSPLILPPAPLLAAAVRTPLELCLLGDTAGRRRVRAAPHVDHIRATSVASTRHRAVSSLPKKHRHLLLFLLLLRQTDRLTD